MQDNWFQLLFPNKMMRNRRKNCQVQQMKCLSNIRLLLASNFPASMAVEIGYTQFLNNLGFSKARTQSLRHLSI